jgi:hypothetical protein
MSKVLFDVALLNTYSDPRWFLLPYGISRATRDVVDVVEVYELDDHARVVVGHLGALDGMYALLLPPGGSVRLRQLPLLALDEPPQHISIDVVIAPTLTIGGEPAANWFGVDPVSDPEAEVDAAPLRDQAAVQSARYPPGGGEVPIEYVNGEHVTVDVEVSAD